MNYFSFQGDRRLDITANDRWIDPSILSEFEKDTASILSIARTGQPKVAVYGSARVIPDECCEVLRSVVIEFNNRFGYQVLTGAGSGTMSFAASLVQDACTVGLRAGFLTGEHTDQQFGSLYSCDALMCVRRFGLTTLPDAIVATPGGLGTINEVLEATFLKLNHILNSAPVLLIDNSSGYWREFKSFLLENVLPPGQRADAERLLKVLPPDATQVDIKSAVHDIHATCEQGKYLQERWFQSFAFRRAYDELGVALDLLKRRDEIIPAAGKQRVAIIMDRQGICSEITEEIVQALDPKTQAVLTNLDSVSRAAFASKRQFIAVDSAVNPTAEAIPWTDIARAKSGDGMGFRTGEFEFVARFLTTTAQEGAIFFPTGIQSFVALSEVAMLRQLGLISKTTPVLLADSNERTFSRFADFLAKHAAGGGFLSEGDEVIGEIIPPNTHDLKTAVKTRLAA